jgi:hypothetical protein
MKYEYIGDEALAELIAEHNKDPQAWWAAWNERAARACEATRRRERFTIIHGGKTAN